MPSKLYPLLCTLLLSFCTHTIHHHKWEARRKAAGEFAVDCVLWEVGSQLMSSALRAHRATQFAEALRGGKFTEEAILDLTNAIKTGNATKSLQQLKQTLFKYPELKKVITFTERGGKLKKVSMLTEAMEGGVGMEKAAQGVGMVEKGVEAGIDLNEVIKEFSKHGINQTINRGFKPSDILKIIREGKKVEKIGKYGTPVIKYTLEGNTVIVNKKGKIITMFSTASDGFLIPLKK